MQSRAMSLVEAVANVVVGLGVAVLTQMLVFPLFGFQASLDQNFGIAMVFTVVSLVRSYALRRLFELLQRSRDSLFPFGEAPSYSHGAESAGNSADGRQP